MNGHRLTEGKAVVAVRLTALAGRPETVRQHLARIGTARQDVRAEATLLEALVVPGPETPARAGVLGADRRTTTVQHARRLGLLPCPHPDHPIRVGPRFAGIRSTLSRPDVINRREVVGSSIGVRGCGSSPCSTTSP
jgi:hypothetical protein